MKLRNHLQAYIQHLHPEWQQISVSKLLKMPTGWETDMFAFNILYQDEGTPKSKSLVLRVYPGDDASEKSRHEFDGMQILHEAGYPVPKVYGVESKPTPSGKAFLIMERIEGEVMGTLLQNSSRQQQARLLAQYCELFVRLHNLDWRPFTKVQQRIEAGGRSYFTNAWLDQAREAMGRYEKYELKPVLEWIIQHQVEMEIEKPSVTHRDYHPNNVLLRPDGSAVVIDWSSWRVTDYRFDLAWSLMLAYAYSGAGMRRTLLEGYESAASKRTANIEVFEVCACYRRLLDVIASLTHGSESRGMRPQAVENMRSQMEHLRRVYELLKAHSAVHIPEVESILDA